MKKNWPERVGFDERTELDAKKTKQKKKKKKEQRKNGERKGGGLIWCRCTAGAFYASKRGEREDMQRQGRAATLLCLAC
jgi:hypothetical protein